MVFRSRAASSIHLAPQDVRRLQFERGPLSKLRRAVPALRVTYTARTASGLYEQSDEGYGEIRYSLAGRFGHLIEPAIRPSSII